MSDSLVEIFLGMILEMSPLLPGYRNRSAIQCGKNAAAFRVQLFLFCLSYKMSHMEPPSKSTHQLCLAGLPDLVEEKGE